MIKLLPFILIPIFILAILGYWRYSVNKQSITADTTISAPTTNAITEVPKTLPALSVDDKVKSLDDSLSKLTIQVNTLKGSTQSTQANSAFDTRLSSVEGAITELKARVSALEKATPTSSSSKSTIYIPLGSGGTVQVNDWTTLNTFQINLDPSQYPGYSSMQLEVNMRLNQPGGTLYVRLYNTSSSAAISSEVTSTSTSSSIYNSSNFTLSSGSKNYVLQAKTSDGSPAFLDNARIKVNF